MKLIDIGCNLIHKHLLNDYKNIIKSGKEQGVCKIIITGSDAQSNQEALHLSEQEEDLYCTIGFHPHHANDWKESYIPVHLYSLDHKKALAVGETGLDYFRNFASVANQKKCFREQLGIAAQVQKPLFLHERNAFADFSRILQAERPHFTNAVWHCFTGNQYQLEWAIDQGFYIGITGWICDPLRGENLRQIARLIPENRLMIETDAPYLSPKTLEPTPRSNKPEYLGEVLRVLAAAREEDAELLSQSIYRNTLEFFSLELEP